MLPIFMQGQYQEGVLKSNPANQHITLNTPCFSSKIGIMPKKNTRKNKQKLKRKNGLPKLASDNDFLDAFLMDGQEAVKEKQEDLKKPVEPRPNLNKHGLPFLDDYETWMNKNIDSHIPSDDKTPEQGPEAPEPEVAFSTLLEASLKQNRSPCHAPKPMPLKRRLKRYP